MTKREASRETLERLAEAYHLAQDTSGSSKRETRLEDAYRCWLDETRPLRSRAEVDAEIVAEARLFWASPRTATPLRNARLDALCREPTQDSGPSDAHLVCAECGLSRAKEPTVAMRWDDVVRCNDCASRLHHYIGLWLSEEK